MTFGIKNTESLFPIFASIVQMVWFLPINFDYFLRLQKG